MSQDMLDHLDRVDVETARDGMLIEIPCETRPAAPRPARAAGARSLTGSGG
jgi:hypothetical protein